VCQQIKDDYQAWSRRRLDEVVLDYLFLDAGFFRMHPGSPAEPVLAAWGITTADPLGQEASGVKPVPQTLPAASLYRSGPS
jgi:hypothetical protein